MKQGNVFSFQNNTVVNVSLNNNGSGNVLKISNTILDDENIKLINENPIVYMYNTISLHFNILLDILNMEILLVIFY